MKKKLLALLSFILAIVLCFAFVACGDDEEETGNSSGKSAEMAAIGKVLDGAQKLATSNAFKATLSGNFEMSRGYSTSTPSTRRSELALTIAKSGEWVRYSGVADGGASDGYINLETGYMYSPYGYYDHDSDKYVYVSGKYDYNSVTPGGMLDYYKKLIEEEIAALGNMSDFGLSWLSDYVSYDSRAKKVTIRINIGDDVNKYLNALYANANGSLYDFLNAALADRYPDSATPATALIDELIDDFDANKNKKLGDYLEILEQDSGMTLEQILQTAGVGIEKDMLKKIKARKLDELAAAALNILNGGVQLNDSEISDYLFTQSVVVPADLKAQIAAFKPYIIAALQGYDMNSVISKLGVQSMVDSKFLFTSLTGNAEFSFDDQDMISAATVSFNVGYSQNTSATVRRTEAYSGTYTLAVGSLPASEASSVAFDKNKISEDAYPSYSVAAIANEKSNAVIYFEKGKRNFSFNVSNATGYYYDINGDYEWNWETGYNYPTFDISGKLSYDTATSAFTLDKSAIAGLANRGLKFGTMIQIKVPLSDPIVLDGWSSVDEIRITIQYIPSNFSLTDAIALMPTSL